MGVFNDLPFDMQEYIRNILSGKYAFQLFKLRKSPEDIITALNTIPVTVEHNRYDNDINGEFNYDRNSIIVDINADLLLDPLDPDEWDELHEEANEELNDDDGYEKPEYTMEERRNYTQKFEALLLHETLHALHHIIGLGIIPDYNDIDEDSKYYYDQGEFRAMIDTMKFFSQHRPDIDYDTLIEISKLGNNDLARRSMERAYEVAEMLPPSSYETQFGQQQLFASKNWYKKAAYRWTTKYLADNPEAAVSELITPETKRYLWNTINSNPLKFQAFKNNMTPKEVFDLLMSMRVYFYHNKSKEPNTISAEHHYSVNLNIEYITMYANLNLLDDYRYFGSEDSNKEYINHFLMTLFHELIHALRHNLGLSHKKTYNSAELMVTQNSPQKTKVEAPIKLFDVKPDSNNYKQREYFDSIMHDYLLSQTEFYAFMEELKYMMQVLGYSQEEAKNILLQKYSSNINRTQISGYIDRMLDAINMPTTWEEEEEQGQTKLLNKKHNWYKIALHYTNWANAYWISPTNEIIDTKGDTHQGWIYKSLDYLRLNYDLDLQEDLMNIIDEEAYEYLDSEIKRLQEKRQDLLEENETEGLVWERVNEELAELETENSIDEIRESIYSNFMYKRWAIYFVDKLIGLGWIRIVFKHGIVYVEVSDLEPSSTSVLRRISDFLFSLNLNPKNEIRLGTRNNGEAVFSWGEFINSGLSLSDFLDEKTVTWKRLSDR